MTYRDQWASAHHAPPSAAQTVCIDLDGTIIPWGSLARVRQPFPGVVAALTELRRRGYHIVIWTSRLSPRWWAAEAQQRGVDVAAFAEAQRRMVGRLLVGIPHDEVTAEKLPALAYFDDRAVRVSGDYPLDRALRDFMASQEAVA
jgi:hypothetical protein